MTTLAFGLDAATYLAFYGAVVAPILAPGPDTMYVLTRGLDGRGPGIRPALGIATGVPLHTLLATVGAMTLFRTVPGVVVALRYVGVAYLGYFGVTSFRNDEFDPSIETDAGASLRRGILVNALNPKIAPFFLASFPGLAGRGAGAGVRMVSLGTTYAALAALYLSVVALGANRPGSRLTGTRAAGALNYVDVGAILPLGVILALERARGDRRRRTMDRVRLFVLTE